MRENEMRYRWPLAYNIKKEKKRIKLVVACLLLPTSNLLLPSTVYIGNHIYIISESEEKLYF